MDGYAATCARCSAALAADAETCPACGAPVHPETLPTADTKKKISGHPPGSDEVVDDGGDARFKTGDTILGHYSVVKQLGRGGMGTVYLARDEVSGQEVAVKVLPASLARERDIRERFTQEARALASMDHPNIVPLVTFAQEGEDRFLVMKYLQGEPLDARLRRLGVLPPEHARKVLRAVLSGLGYAHERSVIHRDVKPSNVIIAGDLDGSEAKVVLVDFGIAKKDDGEDHKRLTQTGMLMGTPQYMSPEQISGQPVDGRSDLYAAGLVLFEMLAGRPPFDGQKTFQVLRAHVEQPVPDVREARGSAIPDDLVALCSLLLRKDPAERPSDAQEAIALLDGTGSFPALKPGEPRVTPRTAVVAPPALPTWPPQAPTQAEESAPRTVSVVNASAALDDPSMEEIAAVRPRGRGAVLAAGVVCVAVVAGLAVAHPWRTTAGPAAPTAVDAGTAPDDDDVDKAAMLLLLQTARTSLKNGDAKRAFDAVEAVVDKTPSDPDARSLQVDVRLALGMVDEADDALTALEQIIASDPSVAADIKAHVAEQEAAIAAKRTKKPAAEPPKKPAEPRPEPRPQPRPRARSAPVSDAAVLRAAERTHAGVSACYSEHVQGRDPRASGELTVTVRIAPSGRVEAVRVTNHKGGRLFGDARFHRCVVGEIKKWRFSSWHGEATTVPYTMSFRPSA